MPSLAVQLLNPEKRGTGAKSRSPITSVEVGRCAIKPQLIRGRARSFEPELGIWEGLTGDRRPTFVP
jgi:hypothetical protein